MRIQLNDEQLELDTELRLPQLLEKKHLLDKQGLAVALNMKVVPRSKWEDTMIREGDQLTIIQAAQGG